MKFLAVALVIAFRLHSITAQAEEAKKKFKDDLAPIVKDCMNLHALQEEDIKALRVFEIPPTQEGKCFTECVYTKFGMINGNEFDPTQLKARVQEWLQKYPELYQKVAAMLDTCKNTIKESNPSGVTSAACLRASRSASTPTRSRWRILGNSLHPSMVLEHGASGWTRSFCEMSNKTRVLHHFFTYLIRLLMY